MDRKPSYKELEIRIQELEKTESKHKETEKELKESEAFIRAVMENLPIGVAVNSVDPTVDFDYMNNNFPKFYRTTREALADPDGFWDSVYEETSFREEIKKKILEDCASGDLERMNWKDVPITRKGEETVFINARNIPVPDKQLMISIVWDVTERKYSEEVLRQSEEKYRTMIEHSNDMIWTIDKAGNFTFFNEQTQRTTGLLPSDWIGKSFAPLTIKEELPMLMEIFQKGLKGESHHYKLRLKKQNGSILTISVNTAPILKNGEVNGIVSFGRDITEQQKLESQLQQTQKMQSIGALAGGIAHDFNNILFPILGYSEMLLDDVTKDSLFQDGLYKIYTGALRARDLVQQILTFSRQEKCELKMMKMQPIIKEVLKFIRSTIPTTIDIKQEIQADCGVIKADPTQIHQIIMNLTTNAYHAMEDGGGELKVSLKEIELGEYDVINPDMTPGSYACLTITDTGVGMDQNLTKKIFDPFFTTKEKGKGTGMGLSVVYGIIKSMGGAIQVYSEPGKGTEFKVYIAVEKSSSKEQQRQVKQSIQGGTEHILLVDDEEDIITMEQQMLERLGYKVTSRTSSIEALEAFHVNPDRFDLVITDMAMPNMSGDKLAVKLKKIRPGIPVLLCTGFSENMPQEKAAPLGIMGLLMKPIVMKDLAQTIRDVLDKV